MYKVFVYILPQLIKKLKRRRLRISRIDGQTQKIENPDNLPEEHLRGTIFENVSYLLGMYSFREIREKRESRFYLIKYAKVISKIGKILGKNFMLAHI